MTVFGAPRDMYERLDPALRHLVTARTDLSPHVLGAVRDGLNQRRAEAARSADTVGVEIEQRDVPGASGGDVTVRIYRGGPPPSPAVVYCHSGAFVLGNLDTDHRQCIELARRGRCTVLAVDYRLAPEHPFPAGLEDAAAILDWAARCAAELGIDAAAIGVAGSSAGAALAAGLAQRSAAGLAPPVVVQLLHQPVLDDRPTPSKEEFTATPGVDGPAVQWMWQHYAAGASLPDAAVPSRTDELSSLPATLITCSELDRCATKRSTTHCGSCGPPSPPSCMCSAEPATGSTRWCPNGRSARSSSPSRAVCSAELSYVEPSSASSRATASW